VLHEHGQAQDGAHAERAAVGAQRHGGVAAAGTVQA
jgi:hypothetical protein